MATMLCRSAVRYLSTFSFFLCALFFHGPLLGALYQVDANGRVGADYQDNIRLTETDKLSDSTQSLNFDLNLKRSSTIWRHQLGLGLASRNYTEQDGFDYDNQKVQFDSQWQQAKFSSQFGLSHNRDSSLVSELDVSGLIQNQIRREVSTAFVSGQYSVSELNLLSLQLNGQQVDYADSAQSGLVDYDYYYLNTDWHHQFRPAHRAVIALSLSQYQTELNQQEVKNLGITVGVQGALNELWEYNFSVGVRETTTKTVILVPNFFFFTVTPVEFESDEQGSLLNVQISREFLSHQLRLQLQRSTRPSGGGEFLESDTFSLNQQGRLSRRLSWTNRVQWITNREVSNDSATSDRDYYSLQPGLTWRQSEKSTLSIAYRYRYQEFNNQNSEAEAHAIIFNYQHRWLPYHRSL